jgi:hypothetical protein
VPGPVCPGTLLFAGRSLLVRCVHLSRRVAYSLKEGSVSS